MSENGSRLTLIMIKANDVGTQSCLFVYIDYSLRVCVYLILACMRHVPSSNYVHARVEHDYQLSVRDMLRACPRRG